MVRIEIADFLITPTARDQMWVHRIDADQIYAVLDSFWTMTRNRANRAASHILYGTDEQGRCIAMPIVPTEDPLYGVPSLPGTANRTKPPFCERHEDNEF